MLLQLSLGDAHSYVLSTAENELGVVIAYSEEGTPMVPVGWQEMQCPKTYVKELRKVAKVSPEMISNENVEKIIAFIHIFFAYFIKNFYIYF